MVGVAGVTSKLTELGVTETVNGRTANRAKQGDYAAKLVTFVTQNSGPVRGPAKVTADSPGEGPDVAQHELTGDDRPVPGFPNPQQGGKLEV